MSLEISVRDVISEEMKEEKNKTATDSSKYIIESNFIVEDMSENNISSNSKSGGRRLFNLMKNKNITQSKTLEESKHRSRS
jgi:hypothetical protein